MGWERRNCEAETAGETNVKWAYAYAIILLEGRTLVTNSTRSFIAGLQCFSLLIGLMHMTWPVSIIVHWDIVRYGSSRKTGINPVYSSIACKPNVTGKYFAGVWVWFFFLGFHLTRFVVFPPITSWFLVIAVRQGEVDRLQRHVFFGDSSKLSVGLSEHGIHSSSF